MVRGSPFHQRAYVGVGETVDKQVINNHSIIPIRVILCRLLFCDDCKLPETRPREFILGIDFSSLNDFMYPVL